MNSRRVFYFLLMTVLVIAVLFGTYQANAGSANSSASFLQDPNETCYVIADDGGGPPGDDLLSIVDRVAGEETAIGSPGTFNMEAITYHAPSDTLYGADADRLGTLDLTTGAFTPKAAPFGTGGGVDGEIAFSDVDSLAFDPFTGILYGVHRREGRVNLDDLLFQIDIDTGEHVPNAFDAGVDYVLVDGDYPQNDVDDISIDPTTGNMYAIANTYGANDRLVIIDKETGHVTEVGPLDVDDMEGLTFDTSGQLIGTTGKDGPAETNNKLWEIDKTTGIANVATSIPLTVANDYEGVACLLEWQPTPTPTQTVTPTPTNTPTPTITLTPTPTQPTAVTLLYFRASWIGDTTAKLEWATGSEIDHYGFNIYRAPVPDFSQANLIHFESASGKFGGAEYSYLDVAPSEGSWWYWLADVDTQGKETIYTPVQVDLGANLASGHQLFIPLLLGNR